MNYRRLKKELKNIKEKPMDNLRSKRKQHKRLKDVDVLFIRKSILAPDSLAEKFSVSVRTIKNILSGKTYKKVK